MKKSAFIIAIITGSTASHGVYTYMTLGNPLLTAIVAGITVTLALMTIGVAVGHRPPKTE